MEEYAKILNVAIPIFLLLVLIEWLISKKLGKEVYKGFDTISSLSSGITNIIKDVLGLSIIIISYEFLFDKFSVFTLESNVLMFVLAFIGLDFAGYWAHRLEHEINVLWNRHIIHHSSEEFNLACALRQNISAIVALFTIFFVPMAICGVPPKVVAITAPIHLFAQFWYHTRLIGRMGWLEYVLVTPSHHRVHHAINDEYLDKNYSQVFIVWDKLFGTFQPELPNVTPVYGVKRQVNTWNPILINFQHLWLIVKDAWSTKRWTDKLKIWIKPTGWRPDDMAMSRPVPYTQNANDQVKYRSYESTPFVLWMWVNISLTLVFTLYFFSQIGTLSVVQQFIMAGIIFVNIFGFTTLMDGKKYAFVCHALLLVLSSIYYFYFGAFLVEPFWVFISIFLLITAVDYWFYVASQKENHKLDLA